MHVAPMGARAWDGGGRFRDPAPLLHHCCRSGDVTRSTRRNYATHTVVPLRRAVQALAAEVTANFGKRLEPLGACIGDSRGGVN